MIAFLSLKQIVDMLYQFKVLDYLMVIAALVLIGYKIYKSKGIDFKKICIVDVLVFILALLYGLATLRNLDGIAEGCKIESAFLVYVFGRLYGNEIHKAGKYLAYVGYSIIYVNATYYLIKCIDYYTHDTYPYLGEGDLKNSGALYYYKTDLGIAIIIATVFIYVYSKALIAKYLTMFVVVPPFLFHTNARTEQAIYILLLFSVIIIEVAKLVNKIKAKRQDNKLPQDGGEKEISNNKRLKKRIIALNVIFIFGTLLLTMAFVCLYFSPIKQADFYSYTDLDVVQLHDLNEIFHSRHIIWWDTFHYMINANPITQLIGVDIDKVSFSCHNAVKFMSHCTYLTAFYGTGYIGVYALIIFIYFVFKSAIEDETEYRNKNMFIVFSLWIMFLIVALTTDALEYTQISWFPFIFAGISAGNLVKKKENE